jgi:hypothetical protein
MFRIKEIRGKHMEPTEEEIYEHEVMKANM